MARLATRCRYLGLLLSLLLLACQPLKVPPVPGYDDLDIAELQARMASGTLTARSLTAFYLQRIEALDPALNAVIEVNPDALSIADALDLERQQGAVRGLLHGIPVLIKANIDTADSMATTAGSLALQGHRAPRDAFVIERLRQSGAVILGKTNLSEWANFRSNRSICGWSSVGGQTRNAHDPARNPCGSSSGSAVAVAAGLASVAVGTETNGSIVCPASSNGIVGIKPSLGLVSRRGIIPIAHSQDTAGPMARTVSDAAILLAAMMAEDEQDPSAPAFPDRPPDVVGALAVASLQGVRIGVLRNYTGAGSNAQVEALFDASVERLREAGAVIVDDIRIDQQGLGDAEYQVLLYEFKAGLNDYLAGAGTSISSLEKLIEFNQQHAETVMPLFGQDRLIAAQAKGSLSEPDYLAALQTSKRIARTGIDQAVAQYQLDAIIAPTGGPAWLTDTLNDDRPSGISSSSLAAVSGYPAVTLPSGYVEGLPIGLTFFGANLADARLISLAHAFEQGSN